MRACELAALYSETEHGEASAGFSFQGMNPVRAGGASFLQTEHCLGFSILQAVPHRLAAQQLGLDNSRGVHELPRT